jgi:hypothetical protein
LSGSIALGRDVEHAGRPRPSIVYAFDVDAPEAENSAVALLSKGRKYRRSPNGTMPAARRVSTHVGVSG